MRWLMTGPELMRHSGTDNLGVNLDRLLVYILYLSSQVIAYPSDFNSDQSQLDHILWLPRHFLKKGHTSIQ